MKSQQAPVCGSQPFTDSPAKPNHTSDKLRGDSYALVGCSAFLARQAVGTSVPAFATRNAVLNIVKERTDSIES